jgi:hypothetical protein
VSAPEFNTDSRFMGIDWGVKPSRTVVTIAERQPDGSMRLVKAQLEWPWIGCRHCGGEFWPDEAGMWHCLSCKRPPS